MARKNVIATEPAPVVEPVAITILEETPPDNVEIAAVAKWPSAPLRKLASLRAGVAFDKYKKFDGTADLNASAATVTALETQLSALIETVAQVRQDIRAAKATGDTLRQARACLVLEARLWRAGSLVAERITSLIALNGTDVDLPTSDDLVRGVNVILGSYAAFDRTGKDTYRVSSAMVDMARRMSAAIDEVKGV